MPFTSQQLMELFELDQVSASSLNTYYVSHPNFKIVVDYLGGNSASLNGLTADYENITFQKLLSLLKEIDPVTPNEQLILDVFTHPHIYPYTKHFLAQWLIFYGVNGNSAKAFAAVAAVFKNLGISDDEIFLLYIQHLHYAFNGSRPPDATGDELKKYLLTILPNQLVLKIPYTGGLYWGNSGWSSLYFQLIEEGKPAFIKDYLLSGLMEHEQFAIDYILHYRQGKYVVIVTNWLQEPSKSNQEFEKKFQIVIHLYQLDNEKFYKLALAFSRSYISYHQLNKPDEKWQRHLHLRIEELKDNTYISFSAAAIYFLLLGDPASTQETVLEWYKSKVPITFDVLRILYVKLKESALPYLQRGLKTDASSGGTEAYRKIINLLVKEFQSKDYIEILWELASSKSKPLREEVAKLLAEKDENAEQKAIQLLQSKNAESRQTAALVLSFFNSANSINAVKAILNTEANDNARDILLQIAAASLPVKADKEFINEMVQAAANRNKLNKPIETWLNETELPPLFYKDGEQLSQQDVRFLFYRMSRVKAMRSDIEAKYLIELLDKERSGAFAKRILQLFIDKEAKPDYKYLMALAALLGGDETVDKLKTIINGWIEINRTKMAEYGIGALALQGSNKALRLVEYYSRKYKNKTASVGCAALQALEDAAEELNISIHELGDRIVPDFGFDGLFKHFSIDGEEYRAFIDSNFKLAFFDEDNKKLKALPPNADKELKEEFKGIVKEIKDVVKSQTLRLEHYLVTQRRWTAEEWQKFYLTNPVMFIYATRLLWGKYSREGRLLECFLCLDDTSLINIEEDEIEIDENAAIGIVHPIQLDQHLLQQWKQKLFNLSIETILPQLDRKIASVAEQDINKTISYQFDGVATENGAIRTTLEKHGWRKGQTGDGGYLDHFIFENKTSGISAILEVEGVFVGGFGYDSDPKLGKLFFIDKKKETARWFIFPKDEADVRLVKPGDVDPIFYSEVVGSITQVKLKNTVL